MNTLKEIQFSFRQLASLNKARDLTKNKLRKMRQNTKTKLDRIEDIDIESLIYKEKGSIEYQIIREYQKDVWSKNIVHVCNLLNQLPNFVTFTQYYHLTENCIRQLASMAKLKMMKKDEVLFNIKDESEEFYIIIKGSIITSGKSNSNDMLNMNFNETRSLTAGYCFGEFGLYYSLPRSQTCLAGEDTVLLYITKESFNKILKKAMTKAESDKKKLVSTILPSIKYLSQKKFLSFYKHFIFYIYQKNDLVFKQGDIADSIYLIQYGKCRLIKNNRHILTLGHNDFIGLEAIDNNPCIKNYNNNTNKVIKYEYSLYCHENCTILQIKLSSLGDYYDQIKKSIDTLRKTKEGIISKYYEINEQCTNHQYNYLSYLHDLKKTECLNDFNTNKTPSPIILKYKMQLTKNSVLMKKKTIKLDVIRKGLCKLIYKPFFSEPNLSSFLLGKPQKGTIYAKGTKSRNKLNSNLTEKLYGDTSPLKITEANNDKAKLYEFHTGTCSLPLVVFSNYTNNVLYSSF